jgi:hypothetical protein
MIPIFFSDKHIFKDYYTLPSTSTYKLDIIDGKMSKIQIL